MKKIYKTPVDELIVICANDVITASPFNGNEINVGNNGDSIDLPLV